jgi:drug/metabolite transporter (DMT)-like permease
MGAAFVGTMAVSALTGGWRAVTLGQFGLLAASSAVGIMLASTTYLATIRATGPRASALLFSLAAPFGVIFGRVFLGEVVSPGQALGILLVLAGIALAILAKPDQGAPARPVVAGARAWAGVALGVVTAAGQAAGTLLARPAMAGGVEPFTAMAIRSGLGAVFFLALLARPATRSPRLPAPPPWPDSCLGADGDGPGHGFDDSRAFQRAGRGGGGAHLDHARDEDPADDLAGHAPRAWARAVPAVAEAALISRSG